MYMATSNCPLLQTAAEDLFDKQCISQCSLNHLFCTICSLETVVISVVSLYMMLVSITRHFYCMLILYVCVKYSICPSFTSLPCTSSKKSLC